MKKTRTLLIIVGWFAAGYALWNVTVGLHFHWNFFNWSPKWDAKAALDGGGILAILGCFWFLARVTRDRVSEVMSFIVCLLLLTFWR